MKGKNIKPPFRSSRLLLVFRRRYANQTMTNSLMYIILAERFFRFMLKVKANSISMFHGIALARAIKRNQVRSRGPCPLFISVFHRCRLFDWSVLFPKIRLHQVLGKKG